MSDSRSRVSLLPILCGAAAAVLLPAVAPAQQPAPFTDAPPTAKETRREQARWASLAADHLAHERYQEAFDALGRAGDSDRVLFNRAFAASRLGLATDAASMWQRVDRETTDPALAAAARFNLGRLAFDEAAALQEQSPEAALERLRDSERLMRSSLALQPMQHDARRSIQAVQQTISAITNRMTEEQPQQSGQEQQQQQQGANGSSGSPSGQRGQPPSEGQNGSPSQPSEQSQQGEQGDPEAAEMLDRLARYQDEVRAETERLAKAQSAPQANDQLSPEQQESLRERLEDLQRALRDTTESAAERLRDRRPPQQTEPTTEPSEPKPEGDQAPERDQAIDEAVRRALEAQSRAAEALDRNEPASAAPDQSSAAEALRRAAEAARGEPGQNAPDQSREQTESQREQARQEPSQTDQRESESGQPEDRPFDVLAAQILRKEQRDRAAIQQYLMRNRGRVLQPERDW